MPSDDAAPRRLVVRRLREGDTLPPAADVIHTEAVGGRSTIKVWYLEPDREQ